MENWKDISGYEGVYQISDLGNVKSLSVVVNCGIKNNSSRMKPERILSPIKSSLGYLIVSLSKNGKYKQKFIHRLVASEFICNTDNKKEVNHIDGNKENNNAHNLEWCTRSENSQHSYDIGLQKRKFGSTNPMSKIVYQFDLNENFIKKWDCSKAPALAFGISYQMILKCCNGRAISAGGYKWKR